MFFFIKDSSKLKRLYFFFGLKFCIETYLFDLKRRYFRSDKNGLLTRNKNLFSRYLREYNFCIVFRLCLTPKKAVKHITIILFYDLDSDYWFSIFWYRKTALLSSPPYSLPLAQMSFINDVTNLQNLFETQTSYLYLWQRGRLYMKKSNLIQFEYVHFTLSYFLGITEI